SRQPRHPPGSRRFPYTPLFRSGGSRAGRLCCCARARERGSLTSWRLSSSLRAQGGQGERTSTSGGSARRPGGPLDGPPGLVRSATGQELLISQITAPFPTVSPALTDRPVTVPDLCAVNGCSIFMASMTTIVSPSETSWPSEATTLTIVPCIGLTRASPLTAGADFFREPPRLPDFFAGA